MVASESANGMLNSLPQDVHRALTVLSAAVSLTDEVAHELLRACISTVFHATAFIDTLHLSDFVVERNSEWHIRSTERELLLNCLHKDPELARQAHSILYRVAKEADPTLAGEAVPTYLTWPVGLAYHYAVSDPIQALRMYTSAYTGLNTGRQWLLGKLAMEQQAIGVLPGSAIEPPFLQGMAAYREGRVRDAERFLSRVVQSTEDRIEVAIALHILGLIRQREHRKEAEELMRRSLALGERIGHLHHQAQVLNSLGNLMRRHNDWELARDYYERALRISTHPKDMAIAHLGLSHVAEKHDRDVESAISHMLKAIRSQEISDRPDLVVRHRRRLQSLRAGV